MSKNRFLIECTIIIIIKQKIKVEINEYHLKIVVEQQLADKKDIYQIF